MEYFPKDLLKYKKLLLGDKYKCKSMEGCNSKFPSNQNEGEDEENNYFTDADKMS